MGVVRAPCSNMEDKLTGFVRVLESAWKWKLVFKGPWKSLKKSVFPKSPWKSLKIASLCMVKILGCPFSIAMPSRTLYRHCMHTDNCRPTGQAMVYHRDVYCSEALADCRSSMLRQQQCLYVTRNTWCWLAELQPCACCAVLSVVVVVSSC